MFTEYPLRQIKLVEKDKLAHRLSLRHIPVGRMGIWGYGDMGIQVWRRTLLHIRLGKIRSSHNANSASTAPYPPTTKH
jgi:hypothetical protein